MSFLANCSTALPVLACRGLTELQSMENYIAFSLLILSTHFKPLQSCFSSYSIIIPNDTICVYIWLCAYSSRTLCAGTRLTSTVSNSSCDTVSPSQMMELIRSTMCMCTFWLWPLLGKQVRSVKRQGRHLCTT